MFNNLITWFIKNKEWILSGIGTVSLFTILGFIFKKYQSTSSQTIKSGNNSTNIQAGNDVNLAIKTKRNQ